MILEVQNGCFGYPKQPVILENINLRLEEGHILAILGPNGIGKTTLLKCMIGLLPWHSGKTLFYGKDIHTLKPKDVWSTISYIPQSRGFAFSYTGLEMVLLGRSAHLGTFQQPGKEEIEMAEAMMERVGITRLANKDCNRMSGGELQMVLIARALINEPKLIILDEPETGLDFHNQILVLNMVERLAHESGISAIMNTHYPTNAMSVADEALMLNRKGKFFYGPAAEILNEENISYSFDVQVLVDELHYQGAVGAQHRSGCSAGGNCCMNNVPFTLSQVRPIRDAMTVSRPSGLGYGVPVTWFSLGAGTSITPEYYDCTTLYLGGEGNGKFLLGVDGQEVSVKPGEVLYVPPKTLCGTKTDSGMIYTEIILKKENFTMNNIIKAGQPTELKNLISYEEGSIANLDIAHADNMKFVLMAFDEGTGLTPHRAPGNAILTALEGKAIIGYEGKDYELNAGESFRFDKNGLHSVTAQGKFKMSLLLVIE